MWGRIRLALAGGLAAWKLIELVLDWVGLIDQVRSMMDPTHWVYRVLFWPHLGLLMSGLGLCLLVAILFQRRKQGFAVSEEAQITLSYDQSDPSCYQPNGRVSAQLGNESVSYSETLYRLGIRSGQQLRGCRLILEDADPRPRDPGMQRIGLPLRPRYPATRGSAEFDVNPNAPAYVDVLQELLRDPNPMNEWSRIRMIYVNEDRGASRWFENGNYILVFRLEGPFQPVRYRLAVRYEGRRWIVGSSSPSPELPAAATIGDERLPLASVPRGSLPYDSGPATLPPISVLVVKHWIYISRIRLFNTTNETRYVTIENADQTRKILDAYPLQPKAVFNEPYGDMSIDGIRWHADAVGVEGQIVGRQNPY